jgi:hypothetical protein
MNIDFTLTNLAIEEIQAKGEQVTIKKIADITGYKYSELYSSRKFNQYIRCSRVSESISKRRDRATKAFIARMDAEKAERERNAQSKKNEEAKSGSATQYVEINVVGLADDDWFTREVGAYMCLEAFNKLMGRKGDRKIRQADIEALKP